MDIQNRTILVLGGWGLVGSAVCRRFMEEKSRCIIVTSLTKRDAQEAVAALRREYPRTGRSFFVPWWGNIFVRQSLKDIGREELLVNRKLRGMLIEDTLSDLTEPVLKRSSLYRLMQTYKPDIVVDCVNSATAIAYQDIFSIARRVSTQVSSARRVTRSKNRLNDLLDSTERLICTLYVPQLVRHVQIIYRAMCDAGTTMYVKIGTSGTGGMGLNIPYTHSEERPSRVLLSKSAVAGAHTLLLFLMARTPDAPITKEIKPAAAIAWKRIGFGEILKGGHPVPLEDCPVEQAIRLGKRLELTMRNGVKRTGRVLTSVFIDTGENGIFSRNEFEAISTPGQMEYVTPEEIAENTVFEIKAGNTGHDVINALDNATLAPTYRAGFMFTSALERMQELEMKHGVESVAFEMLGPPRLSKLLYEAYLLKLSFTDFPSIAQASPNNISRVLDNTIRTTSDLRTRIISIGIPILLADGKSLLRGSIIKIPPYRGEETVRITPKQVDQWAHDGWVDLRAKNMKLWKERFIQIVDMVSNLPQAETSSRSMYNREYWKNFAEINPGKVCGWIFTFEEKGKRMKA